jgi:hypothetical protein
MKEHQHAAEAEIPPRNYLRNCPRNATAQRNITTATGEVTRLLLACQEAISWLWKYCLTAKGGAIQKSLQRGKSK